MSNSFYIHRLFINDYICIERIIHKYSFFFLHF